MGRNRLRNIERKMRPQHRRERWLTIYENMDSNNYNLVYVSEELLQLFGEDVENYPELDEVVGRGATRVVNKESDFYGQLRKKEELVIDGTLINLMIITTVRPGEVDRETGNNVVDFTN